MGFWSRAADVAEFLIDPKNIGTAAGFAIGGPMGAAAGRGIGGMFPGIDIDSDDDIYGQEKRDSVLADGITKEDFARLGKDAITGYTVGKIGQQVPGIRNLEGAFAGGGAAATETATTAAVNMPEVGSEAVQQVLPEVGSEAVQQVLPEVGGGATNLNLTNFSDGGPGIGLGTADQTAGLPNVFQQGMEDRMQIPDLTAKYATPGVPPVSAASAGDSANESLLEFIKSQQNQGDSLTDAYMKVQLASSGAQALGSLFDDRPHGSKAAARIFGGELGRADARRRRLPSTFTPFNQSRYATTRTG